MKRHLGADIDVERLVTAEGALVSRRIFVDPEIYRLEQERVFDRCWLFLGHESQLAAPGDFFTAYLGEQPVIVTRDDRGVLQAFLNTCRHRGMMVCRADQGNAASFSCPYHGWTYRNDGRLIGVPKHKEAYHGGLEKDHWGLIPVAQLASYKGLIFATLDPQAPSLKSYLGDMAWYLDIFLDGHAGGSEVLFGVQKWRLPANWKFFAESFVGDLMHVAHSHSSAFKADRQVRGDELEQRRRAFRQRPGSLPFTSRPGDGFGVSALYAAADAPIEDCFPNFREPVIREYYHAVHAQRRERLGAERSRVVLAIGTVFPNLCFAPANYTIRIAHPRGPALMEIWSWCLVDKAAPPEVKDAMRRCYQPLLGPSGMLEQDDGENWERASQGAAIAASWDHPFNYQMGVGHEFSHPELPGVLGPLDSEGNLRGFYRRWAAHLREESTLPGSGP